MSLKIKSLLASTLLLVSMLIALPAKAYEVHLWEKVTASDADSSSNFGIDNDSFGDYAIIGANAGLNADGARAGAAYIYKQLPSGQYIEQAKLVASDGLAGDSFGSSVAINGDVAVVAANRKPHFGNDYIGAIYIFKKQPNEQWLEIQKIVPSEGVISRSGNNFGRTMAMSNTTIVVGGYSGNYGRSVYLYEFDGSEWAESQILKTPNGGYAFGVSVAISGNNLVVGDYADSYQLGKGSVGGALIFNKNQQGQWHYQTTLKASKGFDASTFGWSVGIDGGTVVVGANSERSDISQSITSGAAYVFQQDNLLNWHEVAILKDNQLSHWVGSSIDIANNNIVLGGRGLASHYKKSVLGNYIHIGNIQGEGMRVYNWGGNINISSIGILMGNIHSNPETVQSFKFDLSKDWPALQVKSHTVSTGELVLTWNPPIDTNHYILIQRTPDGLETEIAINSSLGKQTLYLLSSGEYQFVLKSCNTQCDGQTSEPLIVWGESNVVSGELGLNHNIPTGRVWPQSNSTLFDFSLFKDYQANRYQLSYSYNDFDLQPQTSTQDIVVDQQGFAINVPENTANGFITFYLTMFFNDGSSQQHKVTGELKRYLEAPEITNLSYSLNNDTQFTASWMPSPLADFYDLQVVYFVNGSKQSSTISMITETQKEFNLLNLSQNKAIEGIVFIEVVAKKRHQAITESNRGIAREVLWRTPDVGGYPPMLELQNPTKTKMTLGEPVNVSVLASDDGGIAKAIFKISGLNVNVPAINFSDPAGYGISHVFSHDFSEYFNGQTISSYLLTIDVFDNYGKSSQQKYQFSLSATDVLPPQVISVENLGNAMYGITWNGTNYANRTMIVGVNDQGERYAVTNAITNGYTRVVARHPFSYYYIYACYSGTCKSSQNFTLNPFVDENILTLKTELLGTAVTK